MRTDYLIANVNLFLDPYISVIYLYFQYFDLFPMLLIGGLSSIIGIQEIWQFRFKQSLSVFDRSDRLFSKISSQQPGYNRVSNEITSWVMLIQLTDYRKNRPTFALISVGSLATSSETSYIVLSSSLPIYHMWITWSIDDNNGSLICVILFLAYEGLLERTVWKQTLWKLYQHQNSRRINWGHLKCNVLSWNSSSW